ncbi:CPBP family intramembrane metalloprotease [Leptolyngbya sp. SLC-A1]|nr:MULTISPECIES: CPBP family intramembrane glutamic endopeptidase [Cyanophyceae]
MSKVSSDHPQKTPAASAPNKVSRPDWLEVVVGLVVCAIVGYGGGSQLSRLGLDPVVYGLVFTALSGVAGIAGFAAAVLLRIRPLRAFGVRRTSRRWLITGAGAGVVTFVVKGLADLTYIAITGDSSTPQTMYAEGGSGGILSLILATMFLGLLTPLGEELLFRGVVANALLRYGPFIGVVGSTLDFRPRSRHQYRLPFSCGNESCRCRAAAPQWLGLARCRRSCRLQPAHDSGNGARRYGLNYQQPD